jgi:hypothetical protein
MNEMDLVDTPEEFTTKAIILLKEYLKKLRSLKNKARLLLEDYYANKTKYGAHTQRIYTADYEALAHQCNRLFPAIIRFNQQVSGMIDQGKLTPLMRAELQLRLAEVESALFQIQSLTNTYQQILRDM